MINEDVKRTPHSASNMSVDAKIHESLRVIFDNYIKFSDRLSIMTYGKNVSKLFNLISIEQNNVILRKQITVDEETGKSRLNMVLDKGGYTRNGFEPPDSDESPRNNENDYTPVQSNSNLLKGIKEAISEFVERNGGPQAQKDLAEMNTRVLVIFTSKFNLDKEFQNPEELNNVIFKLHALKIQIIIFGYEIGSGDEDGKFGSVNFKDSQIGTETRHNPSPDEEQIYKFKKAVETFDWRKV